MSHAGQLTQPGAHQTPHQPTRIRRTAGKLFDVPLAFDNQHDLVNSDAVDVVAVTVKVPHHLELATAALEAGEAVYCEWPLGNGLAEAETLAALARKPGVLAVAGLQARAAPAVAYIRDLVSQGFVGEVLSTTLVGSGMEPCRGRTGSGTTYRPVTAQSINGWTSSSRIRAT
jgi:predicted dehydrogenase